MEPPKALVLADEISWILKEPAVVTWDDSNRGRTSLGQSCPNNGPVELTLWVGERHNDDPMLMVMLQLTITRRISRRTKSFDMFLILQPSSCRADEVSSVPLASVPEEIQAFRRPLCVPFRHECPGRVLMNIQPEDAKAFNGTPLHLLLLFHSLSKMHTFDIYLGYSDYAKLGLSILETRLKANGFRMPEVDLPRSYGGKGGVFDDWKQYNAQYFRDAASPPPYCVAKCVKRSHVSDGSESEGPCSKLPRVASGSSTVPNTPSTRQGLSLPGTPINANTSGSKQGQSFFDDQHCLKSSGVHLDASPRSSHLHGDGDQATNNAPNNHRHTQGTREISLPAYHDITATPLAPVPASSASHETVDKENTQSTRTLGSRQNSPLPVYSATFGTDTKPTAWLKSFMASKAEALANHALRQNMESFLEHIEYDHNMREVEINEAVDEAKTELHSARDQGVSDLEEHAQECLANFKDDLKTIMNSALEDLESKMAEASPAAVAARVLLRDFDIPMAAKVTALQHVAKERNAEVFLAVDQDVREVLVAAWVGEALPEAPASESHLSGCKTFAEDC